MSGAGTLTAVVTADNHLNRYYDRMPPQKLEERRRYLRRAFHQAVEHAIEHRVDLFLQAGDLFDTPDPRNLDREFVASELGRLRSAGVRVYGVGGNHDTPKQRTEQGAALPQGIYSELGALHLFEGDGVPTDILHVNGLRVAIGALPWSPTVGPGRDPLENVEWAPEADLGIFLFHHSIEGHIFPGANESIVSKASLDRLSNTQLVIAGHVHHGADWRMGPMHVLIPGATELMTFGETGTPSFSVVELAPGGGVVRLERITVNHQRRRTVTVRTTDLELGGSDVDLCAAIMRRIEPSTEPQTMVRLVLEGPVTREEYRALDLPRLFEFGQTRAFHFDVDSGGLFIQEEMGQRVAGGVRISQREELTACADELISRTDDACERSLLEETRDSILAFYESKVAA